MPNNENGWQGRVDTKQRENNQASYPAKGWATYPMGGYMDHTVFNITDWSPGDSTPSWSPVAGGRGWGDHRVGGAGNGGNVTATQSAAGTESAAGSNTAGGVVGGAAQRVAGRPTASTPTSTAGGTSLASGLSRGGGTVTGNGTASNSNTGTTRNNAGGTCRRSTRSIKKRKVLRDLKTSHQILKI